MPLPIASSRTRIKFCGITRVEDALAAVDAGADAIGLILHAANARRKIDLQTAHHIVNAIPPMVDVVGVFVDAGPTLVRQMAMSLGLSTVQLHGDEPLSTLKNLRPLRLINRERQDTSRWLDFPLAGLLLDSAQSGGSGERTDFAAFNLTERHRLPPLILAGGLTAETVGDVVRRYRPYAVDVSSGIEDEPCLKSVEKMRAFAAAVHAVASAPDA